MRLWRKILAVWVVFCLYAVSAAPTFTPDSIKQRVDEFGIGARVNLKLAGGRKVTGSIQSIDDSGFLVSERDKAARRIGYDEVGQVKLAARNYRAHGQPDPTAARRVVVNLGVGKHAVVKFGGGELHGHIQSVGADTFALLPDHQTAPVQIAYSDVRYVEKNLSLGATVVLVVLILAGLIVVATVAATK